MAYPNIFGPKPDLCSDDVFPSLDNSTAGEFDSASVLFDSDHHRPSTSSSVTQGQRNGNRCSDYPGVAKGSRDDSYHSSRYPAPSDRVLRTRTPTRSYDIPTTCQQNGNSAVLKRSAPEAASQASPVREIRTQAQAHHRRSDVEAEGADDAVMSTGYTHPLSGYLDTFQTGKAGLPSSPARGRGRGRGSAKASARSPAPQQRYADAGHKATCHRCGNIRRGYTRCERCPYTFCGKCTDKMLEEHGQQVFNGGCPVCKELCCCGRNKTLACLRRYHCYRKCPLSKHTTGAIAASAACASNPSSSSRRGASSLGGMGIDLGMPAIIVGGGGGHSGALKQVLPSMDPSSLLAMLPRPCVSHNRSDCPICPRPPAATATAAQRDRHFTRPRHSRRAGGRMFDDDESAAFVPLCSLALPTGPLIPPSGPTNDTFTFGTVSNNSTLSSSCLSPLDGFPDGLSSLLLCQPAIGGLSVAGVRPTRVPSSGSGTLDALRSSPSSAALATGDPPETQEGEEGGMEGAGPQLPLLLGDVAALQRHSLLTNNSDELTGTQPNGGDAQPGSTDDQHMAQLSSRAKCYSLAVATLPSISAYYQYHKKKMLMRHGIFPEVQPVVMPRKKYALKRKFSDTNYSNYGFVCTGDGALNDGHPSSSSMVGGSRAAACNGNGGMYANTASASASATSIEDYFADDAFFAEFRAMLEDDIESTCSGDNGIFASFIPRPDDDNDDAAAELQVPIPIAVAAVVPSIDRSIFSTVSTATSTSSSTTSSSASSSQEMRDFCQSVLLQDTSSSQERSPIAARTSHPTKPCSEAADPNSKENHTGNKGSSGGLYNIILGEASNCIQV